jgi:hypothetical protein
MFHDAANPTEDELRAWALDPDAMWPTEDWDLILASTHEYDELYIELAAGGVPGGDTFLRCLYILVGESIGSGWRDRSRQHVEQLVTKGASSVDPSVKKWAEAARRALDRLETFNLKEWIHGGAVTDEDAV